MGRKIWTKELRTMWSDCPLLCWGTTCFLSSIVDHGFFSDESSCFLSIPRTMASDGTVGRRRPWPEQPDIWMPAKLRALEWWSSDILCDTRYALDMKHYIWRPQTVENSTVRWSTDSLKRSKIWPLAGRPGGRPTGHFWPILDPSG